MKKINLIKHFLLLITTILIVFDSSHSQSLVLFGLSENFPSLKTRFLLFEEDGGMPYTGFNESNFTVKENGINRIIRYVTCYVDPGSLTPMSIVLAIDISGSMRRVFPNADGSNIYLAKTAAISYLKLLNLGSSECAITSFDDYSYLNQDFTIDRDLLKETVNGLSPDGGTDYNQGFLGNLTGALHIAANGTRERKIVIFLTDGLPETQTNVNNIIQYANQYNITIYCIALGLSAPNDLRNIATSTNGKWFESKVKKEDLEAIYFEILDGEGDISCELAWDSGPDCDRERKVEITYERNAIKMDRRREYTTPASSVPELIPNPKGIRFGCREAGEDSTVQVTIRAGNYTINNVVLNSNDSHFIVNPSNISSISRNSSRNVAVTFSPTGSDYIFSTISINSSNGCPSTIYVSGGCKYNITDSTLKLTNPNGGERFYVGSDTIITWEGAPATDFFELTYSTNAGTDWINIADTTTGLKYDWHVPNTPSDSCLAYVGQLPDSPGPEKLWEKKPLHPVRVIYAEFSSDNNYVISNTDNNAVLWNANTGQKIRDILGAYNVPSYAQFINSSQLKIAIQGHPYFRILDLNGDELYKLQNYSGNNIWTWIDRYDVSSAGDYIVTTHNQWDSQSSTYKWIMRLWNAQTGNHIRMFDSSSDVRHHGGISHIYFNKNDGRRVVTASNDGTIKLWNVSNGSLNRTIDISNSDPDSLYLDALGISPNGNQIAVSYYDRTVPRHYTKIWDISTASTTLLHSFEYFVGHHLSFSPNGSEIAWAWPNVPVKSVSSGNTIANFSYRPHVWSVNYNSDGTRLVGATQDGNVIIWNRSTQSVIQNMEDGHIGWVGSLNFNSDKSRAIIAGFLSINAIMLDTKTGNEIRNYQMGTDSEWNQVTNAVFSPDDSKIAGLINHGKVYIWDVATADTLATFQAIDNWNMVGDIRYTLYGDTLIIAGKHHTVNIWDVSDLGNITLLKTFVHDDVITWAELSQNDILATAQGVWLSGDEEITLWDFNTENEIGTFSGINFARFSPDGWYILAGSHQWNRTSLYDLNEDPPRLIYTFADAMGADFSSDGSKIITVSTDCKKMRIYSVTDTSNIKLLREIDVWTSDDWEIGRDVKNGKHFRISDDDKYISLYTYDGRVFMYGLNLETVQDDVSDSLWAIVKPEVICNHVDMGEELVDNSVELLADIFLENLDPVKVRIDTIMITGDPTDQFDIVSTIPEYIDSLGILPIEFRFKPTAPAEVKSANIEIRTQADTIICSIEGIAVENQLEVMTELIDFGCVRVEDRKDTLEFLLKNIGSTSVDITEVKLIGPDNKQFSLNETGIDTAEAFTIAPGEEKQLHVIFNPYSKGRTSGRIGYYYNGVGSPAVSRLFGEGCYVPMFSSDSTYTFPIIICKPESIDTVVIIENTGRETLIIDTLWIDGSDFELTEPTKTNFVIDSSQIELIGIRFRPQTPGQKNAELVLRSNAYNAVGSENRIALSGYREYVEFELSPKLLKFPNTQTRTDTCFITNTGTVPLTWDNLPIPLGNFTIDTIIPNPTLPNETSAVVVTLVPGDPDLVYDTSFVFKSYCSNEEILRLLSTDAPMISANTNPSHLICDTTEILTFEIENIGSDTLIVQSATFNDPSFLFDTYPFPDSLSPGQINNYPYRFTKSAPGTVSDILTIVSNSDPDSVFTITVKGIKDIIDFNILQNEVDLGIMCPNTVIDTIFEVSNLGTLQTGLVTNNPSEIIVAPTFSLDTGETRTIDIRFTAPSNDIVYGNMVFITDTTCGIIDSVLIKADIITSSISTIDELDLGMLCPGESIDTMITINNTGSIPVDLNITGTPDLNILDFLLHIDTGQDSTFRIEYTAPDSEADINETITIEELFCHTIFTIDIIGIVEQPKVNANDLELSAFVGYTDTGTITIENISKRNLEINTLTVPTPFKILDAINYPIILDADSTIVLNISYTPEPEDTIPIVYNVLLNIQPCDVLDSVLITGNPSSARAVLQVGSAKAPPGSTIQIPIYLRNPKNVIQSGASGFKANLSFNTTLLDPIDYPNDPIIDGIRTIEINDLPVQPDEKSVLKTINFVVGLGNSKETELTLTNYEAIDGIVALDTICGKFTLLGICPEGGSRLLNPDGKVQLMSINPNPVNQTAEIEFELIETGYTKLFISNILGIKVKTLIDGKPRLGRQKITIDTKGLASGTYFIILQTPTEVRNRRMEIVK